MQAPARHAAVEATSGDQASEESGGQLFGVFAGQEGLPMASLVGWQIVGRRKKGKGT